MESITQGIWRWERRHPEWHPGVFGDAVACYALTGGEHLLVVDPLVDDEDDPVVAILERLAGDGRVAILITIPYHARSTDLLRDRFGARRTTVLGAARAAKRLRSARTLEVLAPGEALGGDVVAHAIGKPKRDETPLELPRHRALAFGDAVVGVDGGLRVWDGPLETDSRRRWYHDRYLPTLQPLAQLEIDHVLVTHGPAVVGKGTAALRRALEQPPWQRPGTPGGG